MKLTLFTFHVVFDRFYRMLISTTNSFAYISAQGYPILALLVLIDRITCQLTKKSFIASSGTHLFVFLLFFLNALNFLKFRSHKGLLFASF